MYDISHAVSFLKDAIRAVKDERLETARQCCIIAAIEINELKRSRGGRENQMGLDLEPPTPSGPPEGPDI